MTTQRDSWSLLTDTVKELLGEFDKKAGETGEVRKYKRVSSLSLNDRLVLVDGPCAVTSIVSDGFDADIISVSLANGESYDLIRTSLVQVED